jgi:hypothetical protein
MKIIQRDDLQAELLSVSAGWHHQAEEDRGNHPTQLHPNRFLQAMGLNVTRTVTKINPKRITSSGHHRSNHGSRSLAKLIDTASFAHLSILTENRARAQTAPQSPAGVVHAQRKFY